MKEGFLVLEDVFDEEDCKMVILAMNHARANRYDSKPMNINDSDDKTNVVYESSRSPFVYCYLDTATIRQFNEKVQGELNKITGWNWRDNIQRHCLPVFEYQEGGYINGHRGRDFGFGKNDWVAVGAITSQGEDYIGGSFYLNKEGEASEDGKTVISEDESKRSYFEFQRGSLLLFNNNKHVHGTIPVEKVLRNNRITCSWRIEVV